MDNIFKIKVLHGTTVIDLGQCDVDHISLIILVHAMTEQLTGSSNVPAEEYLVWVQLPWCSDILEVFTYRDLLDVFRGFGLRGCDTKCFRVEQTCYKLCPPAQGSPNQHIEKHEVVEQIGWCDDEASLFDYVYDNDGKSTESGADEEDGENNDNGYGVGLCGDNRDGVGLGGDDGDDRDGVGLGVDDRDGVGLGGNDGDGIGLDGDNGDGVLESMFENVVGNDEITKECMDLFEGYEFRSDDEFSSDLDTNKSQVNVDKLLRGVPFQRDGNEIKFSVGQTFANKEVMRDIFREYVVQEGVILDGIKNDKQRQTYQCNTASCPYRAHASWMVEKSTFMIKTLVDQHECHRVCNNKKAKVKWIASKFDSIMKSNHSINVKVLADLHLEKFNVSVDLKRVYSVKHGVLKQIRSEHVHSFKYLRQYAYTLNQTNPRTVIPMKVQKPLSTFHRLFLSFEAQRLGFLKGCRPFIGLDGCHFKGPCGGILLYVVALDANSGLFPLAVFSARHTYANFRGSYCGDSFKKLFWKASRSSNVYDFNAALKDIGEFKLGDEKWLAKIEPHLLSRFAFDKVIRCDHVSNNMGEAFNSLLGTPQNTDLPAAARVY
ncbi:hypothetical protein Dsin_013444 [Dipteronia sinensis]|uniref:Transposase MuDR plant domain-containing protein n=1 Tax=Dipteronia sinensis TaxID=43782 RepID=A0AAE0E942_9ROSI|nr:hypothetical protein Dsin_013444 [Dipteronia sinensis]